MSEPHSKSDAHSNARTIRSRAPLRLGFAGGGTDLSPFCDVYGGAVLNCTIDKYAHCYVTPRDDGGLTLRSCDHDTSETHRCGVALENVGNLRLHRGAYNRFVKMGYLDPHQGLAITTVTDVPAGSGLGTSSALAVAVCEALREYVGAPFGLYEIAHLAFEIERNDLSFAGGRQDQYAAAFGGVNFIEFLADDRVIVNPLRVHRNVLLEFESSLTICFTGVSRESDRIIRDQTNNMKTHAALTHAALMDLKASAHEMKRALLAGDIREIGAILNRSWASKKQTAATISNQHIECLFAVAMKAGAFAGKLSGAGGGGFMILMSAPEDRADVIRALDKAGGLSTPVQFTREGVQCWRVGSWST